VNPFEFSGKPLLNPKPQGPLAAIATFLALWLIFSLLF